jgi:Pyridoxamine 5'-phosphate oxidase
MSKALGDLQEQSFANATRATVESYPPHRRLTGEQLADYLDRRAFAVIGTTRPDGRPHAAMSSYLRRGTAFWLPTVAGSVRERNLRHQPWLTMTITEGERDEHAVVLLEGPAGAVPAAEVPEDVKAAATGDWVSIWLRLTPTRLLSYAAEGTLV